MFKILILEDQGEHYSDIKKEFEKYPDHFDVYPKQDNDTDKDLNNRGYLVDQLIEGSTDNHDLFRRVADHYIDIDLFVVDSNLYPGKEDHTGSKFLNFLTSVKYRNGAFKYVISTGHNYDKLGIIEFEFDTNLHYVSKRKLGPLFPAEVVLMSRKLLGIVDTPTTITANQSEGVSKVPTSGGIRPPVSPTAKSPFYERRWWLLLPDFIERHIISRYLLVIFYIFIFTTGTYGVIGMIMETIKFFKDVSHTQTKYLEYVEHVFLYILPLLIVASFLNYYKSTIEIRLTGGKINDIDHDTAMASLNNSKLILLSSLISFTIIKGLEILTTAQKLNRLHTIAFGIFLLLLIIFYLLQHKASHSKSGKHG